MGHHFVVGGDVELDEAPKTCEAVERMKVERRVLQGSPECLDHRVRERDLDLSQEPRQSLAIQQVLDGAVDVLASRVCHHDQAISAMSQLSDRFTQDATRPAAPEASLETPRQDPPGIVVDHRMKIGSRSIEQANDRHIQMQEFAGSFCSDADFRLGRIDTFPRASPAHISDESVPRGWRSQDLPASLSVKSQRSQRHVLELVALDHFAHAVDFTWSQACRDDTRSAWLVIEIAPSFGATTTVVARRRDTRNSKRGAERQDSPRPRDRSQEDPCDVTFRKSLVIELDIRCSKHRDQEADDCSEKSGSTSESFDLRGQLGTIVGSDIAGDHLGHAAVHPASNG